MKIRIEGGHGKTQTFQEGSPEHLKWEKDEKEYIRRTDKLSNIIAVLLLLGLLVFVCIRVFSK